MSDSEKETTSYEMASNYELRNRAPNKAAKRPADDDDFDLDYHPPNASANRTKQAKKPRKTAPKPPPNQPEPASGSDRTTPAQIMEEREHIGAVLESLQTKKDAKAQQLTAAKTTVVQSQARASELDVQFTESNNRISQLTAELATARDASKEYQHNYETAKKEQAEAEEAVTSLRSELEALERSEAVWKKVLERIPEA